MPQVPIYRREVEPSASSGGGLEIPQSIGGVANEATQLLNASSNLQSQAFQIAVDAQKRANALIDQKAEIEMDRISNDIYLGIEGLKGENALDSVSYLDDTFKKSTEEFSKNPIYKKRMGQIELIKAKQYEKLRNKAYAHSLSEMDKVGDDQFKAVMDINISNASRDWIDKNAIYDSFQKQKEAIDNESVRKGYGEKWAESELDISKSKTVRQVFERMIDEGYEDTKEIKAYEKEFSGLLRTEDSRVLRRTRDEKKLSDAAIKGIEQREFYMDIVGTDEPLSTKLKKIEDTFYQRKSFMDIGFYEKIKKSVIDNEYGSEIISNEENLDAVDNILNKFSNLRGVEVDLKKRKITSAPEGNAVNKINELTEEIYESRKKLTKKQFNNFMSLLREDKLANRTYGKGVEGVVALMKNIWNSATDRSDKRKQALKTDLIDNAMKAAVESSDPVKIKEEIEKAKQNAFESGSPYSNAKVGDVVGKGTLPDGREYNIYFNGYGSDGNPIHGVEAWVRDNLRK